MDDLYEVIGNNRIEDVSWICSLSEPELDLLIGLKKLVILRAKAIGHVELAEKFDLKMLRAIGLVVMEHFRQKVKDLPPVPGMDETSACIDGCNLLKSKLDKLSIEELKSCLGMKKEKHYFKRPQEQEGPKVRRQSRR
ncbi:unnamed protein product [Linum tenue]|uniref:Uncharacterized protein n=1 Tax=Linum tenue TaxID=586396 RepID=A0AAV0KXQ9_9ROSI|nr:unnamed protein product [Linum tenue]